MDEFERDKKIDPDQLDVEALQQSELFYKWSERAVIARREMDIAKAYFEQVEAKLQLHARRAPGDFGLSKTTDTAIQSAVKVHPDYIKAWSDWLESKATYGKLNAAVTAMEMKKRMIEVLITLHGQQYFAGPSTPRNLGEAYLQERKRAERDLHKRQRKAGSKRKRIKMKKEN